MAAELPNKQLPSRSVSECAPNPRPFVWTRIADQILASITRFAQRIVDVRAGMS